MVALSIAREPDRHSRAEPSLFRIQQHQFHVEARRLDHTLAARRDPRVILEVRDVSFNGLQATSRQPLNEGEHVTVFFPRRGITPEWDAFGQVACCEPCEAGYRVTVDFAPLPAA